MQDTRQQFREFLLRLANNDLRVDDWRNFAVQHYADEEIEDLRRRLVKRSLEFPDWQVGWIPRAFQEAARALAVYLHDVEPISTFYRPEWSDVADDGTIHVRMSWWDTESHTSGRYEVPPGHADHGFWIWLIDHKELRRGSKSEEEIEQLKSQYAHLMNRPQSEL